MSAFPVSFITALGWTLIHSLWQACIIFLVLRLLLFVFRQASSNAKYLLSVGAFAGIFICFLITFYHQWMNQKGLVEIQVSIRDILLPVSSGMHASHVQIQANRISDWFHPEALMPYLVMLYFAGLIFYLIKAAADVFLVRKIRHTCLKPFDQAWGHYVDKISRLWNLPRRAGVFLSERIDVPVVIGYLRPVIYLPLSIAGNLPPEQIEAILLHELAHIRRHDYLVNIMQIVVDTVLFFNPFVRLISRNIRIERENCCDDLVTSVAHPKQYAEALVSLEENRAKQGRFVMAAVPEKQQLFQRIKHIMEMKTKRLNHPQKLLSLLILAGSIVSVAWMTPGNKINKPTVAENLPGTAATSLISVISDSTVSLQAPTPVDTPLTPPPVPQVVTVVPPVPDTTRPFPQNPFQGIDTAKVSAISFGPFNWGYNTYNDSTLKELQKAIQRYQREIRKYSSQIRQLNSIRMKKSREKALRQQAEALKQQAGALKKHMEELKKHPDSTYYWKRFPKYLNNYGYLMMDKLYGPFNSKKWKMPIDSIVFHIDSTRQLAFFDRSKMDSIMNHAKKQIPFIWKNRNPVVLPGGKYVINTDNIVNMMMDDGILKDDKSYNIRINNEGLYINGIKQDHKYYEKYRRLIGNHTTLELQKKDGHITTTIGRDTKDDDNG